MTVGGLATKRLRSTHLRPWLATLLLGGGLAGAAAARTWAARAGLDPLAVGTAFGLALLAVAAIPALGAGRSPAALAGAVPQAQARPTPALLAGGAVGLGLVALAMVGPAVSGVLPVPGLARPAAPFAPWALVIVLVAAAEEVLLRGVLFDRILAIARPPFGRGTADVLAICATAGAFAAMHVPLYGWHVVPLDLAVGLVLGGLRLATGGVLAPAAAHVVADLATWWL